MPSASASTPLAPLDEVLACPSPLGVETQTPSWHLRGDRRICCAGPFGVDAHWETTDVRTCLLATAPGLARPAFAITGGTGPVGSALRTPAGSTSIDQQGPEFLRLVDLLQRFPELRLNVTGSVDEHEGPSASARTKLAERRANAAITAFKAAGIDGSRLRLRNAAEFAEIRHESPDVVQSQLGVPGVVVYGEAPSQVGVEKRDVECQPGTLATLSLPADELARATSDDPERSVSFRFCEEARCAEASFAFASLVTGSKAAISLRGPFPAGALISNENDQLRIEARSVSKASDLTEGRRWSLRVSHRGRTLEQIDRIAHYVTAQDYPGSTAACLQFQFADVTQ